MFLKKPEKRRLNPWCVIMVGGLATVGAISIVTACKDSIKTKMQSITSMLCKKDKCRCDGVVCEE